MTVFTVRAMIVAIALCCAPVAVSAQSTEIDRLRAELDVARAQIQSQERRLQALESRLQLTAPTTGSIEPSSTSATAQPGRSTGPVPVDGVATAGADALERVGEAATLEMPTVQVLGDQGSVITREGQLTAELGAEYARADRNRAVFRGIEIPESVLIGVFDLNESRQDVLTAAGSLRYGVTNGLEVGLRVPYVRRSDVSILAPIIGADPNAVAAADGASRGDGLGDVELSLRYQLTSAAAGKPFLIGNLQVVAPTGSNPFKVRRDELGRALEAATGAGFWGISPSLTGILPTDPAVIFASLGYTRNFAENVDTVISPVRILRVKPGDSVSGSAGIGLAVNQRTSFNLGYAHTWAFGTKTRTQLLDPPVGSDGISNQTSRDLQIGRFLFGVTYRVSDAASVNWTVEVGATDDATDLRTVLRIPIVLFAGSR